MESRCIMSPASLKMFMLTIFFGKSNASLTPNNSFGYTALYILL